MINRLSMFCVVCIVFIASPAFAKTLLLDEVLSAADTHFPKVQAALAKQDAAAGKLQEANGAFDLRLDGESKLRSSGYYDGNYAGGKLVQPIAPLGGEIYAGYRSGTGTFPVYNEDLHTKNGGEVGAGVIFSLLRNRDFDDRRFKVKSAEWNQKAARLDTILTRLATQLKALYAYGEWVVAGETFKVYEDLLNLAQERQKNLVKQIHAGSEAKIKATENEQNLVKRQAFLNDAKRELIKRGNQVSLYWRDQSGNPVMPTHEQLPRHLSALPLPEKAAIEADIVTVVQYRPELKIIDLNLQEQNSRVRLGENSAMPKVDLGFDVSQDQGRGPSRFDGTEGIVSLKVSVPLQRNIGNGQANAAKAQIRQLESEQRLTADTIMTELRGIVADLDANNANLQLSNREVALAEQVETAERKLLDNGSSNIFLVNSREEKTAEARIKKISSELYLFKAVGTYYAATMNFQSLKINTDQSIND